MRRVLFVDDEQRILDGLRRSLRSMKSEWQMEFQLGGKAALAMLENETVDLVVTDMKMPEIDGAELLAEIKKLYPRTIRIVLSGHAEKGAILKAVGTAHQYLSKPCDLDDLKQVIDRSLSLRDMLNNPQLQDLVGGAESLPSLYLELLRKIKNPDVSVARLAAVISKDVAMSGKVLKLVNSAFFGALRPVDNLEAAVAYLGRDSLLSLVLSAGIFCSYDENEESGFSIEELTNHSTLCARLANTIVLVEGRDKLAGEARTAGLLHDTGKLILSTKLHEGYAKILEQARVENLSVKEVELRELGTTHGHVGAYLLGIWGLPDPVLQAVGYHEIPSESADDSFSTLTAVHVASVFANRTGVCDLDNVVLELDKEYLERVGVLDRWPVWQKACAAELE